MARRKLQESEYAIQARGLGKSYRLGQLESYLTIRETVTKQFKQLFGQGKDPNQLDRRRWFKALDDISFDIPKGQIVGIIGHNGAGKSTLLKLISKITEPTEGYVDIEGRVGSLLEVGTGFHPELSGRENIYLNGSILGLRKREIDANFDAIVDFAGVEEFLETPVKRYSSGMRVRLAFAVSAFLNPEILVVDEVLSVGDAEFRKKSLDKMKDVSQTGRTVLFVSHNMGAIQTLTERCMLLNHGTLVEDGPTDKVLDVYTKQVLPQSRTSSSFETNLPGLKINYIKSTNDLKKLGYQKPLNFEVELDSTKPHQDVFIGIQIFNSKMSRICTLSALVKDLKCGTTQISVAWKKSLLPPGFYSVGMGLAKSGHGVFYNNNMISLEIADYNTDDWFLSSRRDVLGVYPPVKVNIK